MRATSNISTGLQNTATSGSTSPFIQSGQTNPAVALFPKEFGTGANTGANPVTPVQPKNPATFSVQSGLLGGVFPTTPVKDHTVTTGADGSVTSKTSYHPDTSNTGLTQQGVLNNLGNYYGTKPTINAIQGAGAIQSSQNNPPQAPYDPNNPQAGLISQLQAAGNAGNTQAGLVGNYLSLANKANQYGAQLSNTEVGNETNRGLLGGLGDARSQVAGALGAPVLQQLTGQANNALTAAQQAQPVSQFGVLTNPLTGQPISTGNVGSQAFNGGVIQGQNAAGQNYANMYIASQGATGVKNTLDDFIKNNPNINTSSLTAGNTLSQWLSGQQLGDANTQTFLDDVSEYVQTLAPVLGVGGTPTDAKSYTAQQFVNGQASGQNVQQVLNNIETLANNKLASIRAAGTGTTAPNITSQTGGQNGGFTEGQTAAGGAIVYKNGQWVANQ